MFVRLHCLAMHYTMNLLKHTVRIHHTCHAIVPQLRFERTHYIVPEDIGTAVVCVELVGGPLGDDVIALVTSLNGQALGE